MNNDKSTHLSLKRWYLEQVEQHQLIFDEMQQKIIITLDQFIANFNQREDALISWFYPFEPGIYIYGSIGSGKSMLMNQMVNATQTSKKLRLHFHEFMQTINSLLNHYKNKSNPLDLIGKKLKQDYQIIFLDEMDVTDIATAMLLKQLFISLTDNQIALILTSNFKPNDLYFDGLMRERFMPAIELIKNKFTILNLNAYTDYRQIHSSFNSLFLIDDLNAHLHLGKIFDKIATYRSKHYDSNVTIMGRQIAVNAYSDNIVWFKFATICGDNRSQIDYLELVKQYKWWIIEDIDLINTSDVIRRFTWLIDILYDNHCNLALSSKLALTQLYVGSDFAKEFARALSRLDEMRTINYLNKPIKD